MPKHKAKGHNHKKYAKQPKRARHKPPEPAGGWPDDDKVLGELEQKAQSTYGVSLRDILVKGNSSPGTCVRTKRDNCTALMARMCAAYVMTMCFGDEMVETSICCAWWWWPVGPIVSWWKRYGWGIWSGDVDFGSKSSGGVRPLMIALGYVGAVGAWVPGLALGHTATRALALFLGCRVELLAPLNLVMVPYYGTLISACFKALNLWMPLLRTSVACTKRGRSICETLGLKKASDTILSGLIFLSKTCMDNGIVYNLPGSWLGHSKKKKLKHRLLFVNPALPLVNNRIVYWSIPHDAPTLKNNEAARRLFLRLKDATALGYINVASSKLNPELAAPATLNASAVNADILNNKRTGADRETCGFGCRAGFFELGQFAAEYDLLEVDPKTGYVTGIKPFRAGYFAKDGLPEKKIRTLVLDRIRFDQYIKLEGWIELFKYIIEKGVFKLKERYDYVLEGLLDARNKPAYAKIKKRLVAKPWASQSATLKKKPLVVTLDAEQLKEVEKAHKVSWKKWFGNGCAGKGSLAISLSRWHWWSWKHEKNMYPEEGKDGYVRPADAKALEVECLGEPFGDLDEELEAEDAERDDELDGVGGAELSQEDVALVAAALDAAGETADAEDVAALAAAATASDDDARSAAADADAGDAGAMDVDGAEPPRAGVRRGTRVRQKPGATEQRIEEEKVKACNLVMDEATGLRPDGDTCWACWRAVYHEGGCEGRHAVIGPDATPFAKCVRVRRGCPYSAAVAFAHAKIKYLEASRAAGNR